MDQGARHNAAHAQAVSAAISDFTAEATPSPANGLVITSLRSGGAAAAAGLAVGDIVIAIDGRPVVDPVRSLRNLRLEGHDRLRLDVTRGRQVRHVVLGKHGGTGHGT
jgi:S1-C subfamily serine protease